MAASIGNLIRFCCCCFFFLLVFHICLFIATKLIRWWISLCFIKINIIFCGWEMSRSTAFIGNGNSKRLRAFAIIIIIRDASEEKEEEDEEIYRSKDFFLIWNKNSKNQLIEFQFNSVVILLWLRDPIEIKFICLFVYLCSLCKKKKNK